METPAHDEPRVGEIVEVVFEKIVAGGDALAHVGRRVLFVPFAAAGDRARVEIVRASAGLLRGRILEIVTPSPDRRAPRCAHFGVCGGCRLQHIVPSAAQAAKAGLVRDALRRIGGIDWPGAIDVRAADEYGWRSRAELHFERSAAALDGARVLGYLREGTHTVCAVTECPVLRPELERAALDLCAGRQPIPRRAHTAVMAAGDDGQVAVAFRDVRGALIEAGGRTEPIHQRIAGFDFALSASAFFQGNRALVTQLVDAATSHDDDRAGADRAAQAAVASTTGRTLAFDLYAGAGLFSLPLCRTFARVVSVESDGESVGLARENARANRIENVEIVEADVPRWLARRSATRPDLVLLDPPRSGAGPAVVDALLELSPAEIRYVSCDPATLARDLRDLVRRYTITSVTALDLFPQTAHVEVVVRLALRACEDIGDARQAHPGT